MKMAWGRVVLGAAAVLFGIIALMWHDPDTWQTVSELWKLPLGTIIGACLMAAQIAGGILVQTPRTVRLGSVVLVIVYLAFSLACIPSILAATNAFEKYGGSFFQMFSVVCGALALYAATEASAAKALALGRVARSGLGVCAISFAWSQVLFFQPTAGLVPKWIPPNQKFWAILTTIAFALAAIALLINVRARLAARLMSVMLALFGVLVWIPHLVGRPKTHFIWSEFALTFLITGASWAVADFRSALSTRSLRAASSGSSQVLA